MLLWGIAIVFLALSWPGAGARGVVSEEVQPSLGRHPVVLSAVRDGAVTRMPPHEAGAPARPRWVATPQWPQLSWNGATRQWPVFIRGHQTALGTYVGIALGPLLGGGVAGLQRSSVLLTLCLVFLAWGLARRSSAFVGSEQHLTTLLAPALVALSFGTVFFGRTGYAFEIASRVMMACALVVASPLRPLSPSRSAIVGVLVGVAILCRATVAVTLLPALAILLAHRARGPRMRHLALMAAPAIVIPLLVLLVISAVAPFARGTAPLADFPFHLLGQRALTAPGHLLTQLAWLGDANAILGPLRNGTEPRLSRLGLAALLGAVPVAAATARWWLGKAGDGERMLVAALLGNVTVGALLYDSSAQFQLAMALDVLLAVALAEQAHALLGRPRSLALVLLLLLGTRGGSTVLGLTQDGHVANPMFSGRTQRATVERLQVLGVRGPELLTTTYDHAGVLEAWSRGALTPVHGWPVLRASGPDGAADLPSRMEGVLRAERPRYVLLSVGPNPMGGPFTDNLAIRASLRTSLQRLGGAITHQWDFPTESGSEGWRLVELRLP